VLDAFGNALGTQDPICHYDGMNGIQSGGNIAVVLPTEHQRHAPEWEINNGELVRPPFDSPERINRIASALAEAHHPLIPATAHDLMHVFRVHTRPLVSFLENAYTEWVKTGGRKQVIPDTFATTKLTRHAPPPALGLGSPGAYCFDTETPIAKETWIAARSSVDAALTATDQILAGAAAAYALCRPPGHHAGTDYYGGYCYLNNAAIATQLLRDTGKVAILDVDYHHGNGTRDIYWADDSVFYTSLHADPNFAYPYYTGRRSERGQDQKCIRNFPLPLGTTDSLYLATLEVALEEVSIRKPDFVVVSVGYDTSADDPIGRFELSTHAYRTLGQLLSNLGKPIILIQEGGYSLETIGTCALQLCAGLSHG
jgi:acetoin utilization deacetylase AcuC-like enzyme